MEHVPCEHCEEVKQEEEDKLFGEALRSCLAEPEGSFNRKLAEQYIEDIFRPDPFIGFSNGPVTFKLWSDNDPE